MNALAGINNLANRVKNYPDCLCLLGLGSMSETTRLDQYSDIDFFLIVKDNTKDFFLNDLTWLEFSKISYSFKNTDVGYKVLFESGDFAEFAIFTESEITDAIFTEGVIYYAKDGFNQDLVKPRNIKPKKPLNVHFNVNEALTNIFIGLKREHRGERSSATTFIQTYAFNLIIPLFELTFDAKPINEDYFVYERRLETRFSDQKDLIGSMRPGYLHNKEAAKVMLDFLMKHFNPNKALCREIINLL